MSEPVRDLVDLVAAMRAAQRRYWRARTQTDLVAAKRLEAQVDGILKELHPAPPPRPPAHALTPELPLG